ncbi:phage tail protein [Pseudomonas aeruginosa]|uniref:phage tail protein n=1 Tax=Pseudomonas aeruginosa TaxID=287 RepID=UPI001E1AA454|nr:phage tail protein [Pseudomonas aeruginosa]MCO3565807.1 phage tail protein [Pseudomonas aeruginosa]
MSASLPNGALLAIAATYGPAIPVTAVSNAKPAVATADAHGLLVGDVVSLVSGWTGLNGRAVKVAAFTEDTFSLGNIDTTDVIRYPAGGGIGSAKKVLTWQQIQQVMNPTTSGGEQQFVQYQYLEDDDQRQLPTFRNAQSFSMPIADDPNLPQWAVIEAADQSKALQVIRLTLRNGSEVFYNGYVSVSDTPTLNVNEIMTRTLTIALDGRPVRYNPAP